MRPLLHSTHSVKTRLQAQEKTAAAGGPKYRGLIHAMVLIMREEGVGRLYRGLLPRLLRVPPGMVCTIRPGLGAQERKRTSI